jgi:hypothetical protein
LNISFILTALTPSTNSNVVNIKDIFNNYFTSRTDLALYYQKVGLVYGPASGRSIEPDFPSA